MRGARVMWRASNVARPVGVPPLILKRGSGRRGSPGEMVEGSAFCPPLTGHDDVDRVGIIISLRGAVLGFQSYEIAGIMEIRVHQPDMLVVAHRPPDGYGFGGKHAIGEDHGEETAGLQNAIDVTENLDRLREGLDRNSQHYRIE